MFLFSSFDSLVSREIIKLDFSVSGNIIIISKNTEIRELFSKKSRF